MRNFRTYTKIGAGITLFLCIVAFSTQEWSIQLRNLKTSGLPTGYNELFAASGECANCHNSQVSPEGKSIALANDWRSTMMANAARDPLWRAKVSVELKENPDFTAVIEQKCTSCHAPGGNFNAVHLGQGYTFEKMDSDIIGLDGVQCTVCHQITLASMGQFSGHLDIGENKTIWGPFTNPFGMPMTNFTGYTPEYSAHIKSSQLCGSCHTLLTQAILKDGSLSETFFVEQSIYHEWLNSSYPEEGKSCQFCHVPRIDGPVKISDRPPALAGRDEFGQHHFVGANLFMNMVFSNHSAELGINANATQLDSTKNRMTRMLQDNSLQIQLEELSRDSQKLRVMLNLQNISGHKLPSGFPSRRMWVEFLAVDATGDTLMHSGAPKPNNQFEGDNEVYQPHYQLISESNQVQIYEMIMGDEDGEMTTELLRAVNPLKDNRIPPRGFSNQHLSYDTVRIVGQADLDANFNRDEGIQGSGSDQLTYEVSVKSGSGAVKITAKVYYQTISEEWLQDIFDSGTEESVDFKAMYDYSNPEPTIMAESSLISQTTQTGDLISREAILLFPNPTDGVLNIRNLEPIASTIVLYTMKGKMVLSVENVIDNIQLDLRREGLNNGVYLLVIQHDNKSYFEKIILN
ncbi:MAG: T9SS type A sorting domain-containing protein [Bacteroidota bacterium]|nr:T9SS type A sorting domain-containing protein [Bacteroidota bacterium]